MAASCRLTVILPNHIKETTCCFFLNDLNGLTVSNITCLFFFVKSLLNKPFGIASLIRRSGRKLPAGRPGVALPRKKEFSHQGIFFFSPANFFGRNRKQKHFSSKKMFPP